MLPPNLIIEVADGEIVHTSVVIIGYLRRLALQGENHTLVERSDIQYRSGGCVGHKDQLIDIGAPILNGRRLRNELSDRAGLIYGLRSFYAGAEITVRFNVDGNRSDHHLTFGILADLHQVGSRRRTEVAGSEVNYAGSRRRYSADLCHCQGVGIDFEEIDGPLIPDRYFVAPVPIEVPNCYRYGLRIVTGITGPAWSPNGKWLAVSNESAPDAPDAIYLVSLANGHKKRLTRPPPGSVGDYDPAFSPHGRRLAFVRTVDQRESADIYIETMATGSIRRVTYDSKIIFGVSWLSSRRIVFSSDRSGSVLLWTVSSRGGSPQHLAGSGRNVSFPSASAGARAIVYAERFRNTDVWRIPLSTAGTGPSTPVRLIASSTENDSGQYSPDGSKIAFASDRSGIPAIWICNADGASPVLLVSGHGSPIGTPRWSPDGRLIAFDLVKNAHSAVAIINVATRQVRMIAAGPADYMMPSWSRDGRFLYYVSPVGTEQSEIWKKPLSGGEAFQITHRGGGEASESPDGATLYYLKGDTGIWQVPSSGGPERPVPGLANVTTSRYFFVGKNAIYFLAGQRPPWIVKKRAFANGKISDIATIPRTPEFRTPSLSVSPDGRWLLYTQLDQSGEDVLMLKSNARQR